jgi:hypothetical protein
MTFKSIFIILQHPVIVGQSVPTVLAGAEVKGHSLKNQDVGQLL